MYYPEELIEEVRTRNDIVEVISGYVRLQKKGSNYFGLCPFHNEKSPSFSVSPGKQMYYCFGCGAGGNVITFLMEYENQTFPEAVRTLAQRAGIALPEAEKGVLIGKVLKGSSADGVLRNGDLLMKVDGYDVDSSAMIELDGQKISMKELIERCFKDDRLPLDIIRDGKPMKVEMVMKPSLSKDLLMAEYDKMPRYIVFGGLVFQPIQRNVLAAADISMLDVALDIRDYQEDGGCVDHEDMVIITKVLDDEVNARLSGSISNAIVEKINGVKVKGLTHAYELLYPKNMPEYVIIELKNGERPET